MKRLIYCGIFIAILILHSCATLFNLKETSVKFIANKPISLILNNDTLYKNCDDERIWVKRNKSPLQVTIYNDSIEKKLTIKARNSFAYWLNLYPNVHLWTGFIIDNKNPKRYTYPKRIYVNMEDTSCRYFTYYPWSRKGQLDIHLSFPYINSFLLKPDNENDYKSNTGFWGINLGIDYYHSPHQFISARISGISDFFCPAPAAIDIMGEYELMSSVYVSLSNNHRLHNFLIGYGICYAVNTWDFRYYDRFEAPPPTRDPIKKKNAAFGFIFPVYYQFGKHFILGLVYRPTLFRISDSNPYHYEHTISLDLGLKFNILHNKHFPL